MKQKFDEMSKAELIAYVLSHRDDDEAIRVLFSRRHPPDSEATWYGPMCTPEGVPIAENIRIAEEAIRQRVDLTSDKQRKKELQKERELEERLRQKIEKEVEAKLRQKIEQEVEARLRQEIEQEPVSSGKDNMTTITQEEIQQFREQLRNYPYALSALDVIKECEGHLEDAAQVIVLEAGKEEVQSDLLEKLSKRCRSVICHEDMKEELPVLVAAISEFLVSSSAFPPGLAMPVAIFVTKKGLKKFCQSSDSDPKLPSQ